MQADPYPLVTMRKYNSLNETLGLLLQLVISIRQPRVDQP